MFDTAKRHHYYFKEISNIPHGSYNEAMLSQYLVDFAKAHRLEWIQDPKLNVIIKKPASIGYEDKDPIILQGHMDMVCEKNKDSNHDFDHDPLVLKEEDGWLTATNTTLGADDGVAVCYMLAILEDKTLVHPALECVFTVEEEVGLFGAKELDQTSLKAPRMISLDGAGQGLTYVTSAGGTRLSINRYFKNTMVIRQGYQITVKGLAGGHSGVDINKPHLNAIRVLFEMLKSFSKRFSGMQIGSGDGGMQMNAIAREASIHVTFNGIGIAQIEVFSEVIRQLMETYQPIEPNMDISFHLSENQLYLSADDSASLINLMTKLPYGVIKMSDQLEGLPETSMNIGRFELKRQLVIQCSIRSMVEAQVDQTIDLVQQHVDQLKGTLEVTGRYPSWQFDPNSKMRERLSTLYQSYFNEPMRYLGIHGGLECGYFTSTTCPRDIITLHPNMAFYHTPKERLDIKSYDDVYDFLVYFIQHVDTN